MLAFARSPTNINVISKWILSTSTYSFSSTALAHSKAHCAPYPKRTHSCGDLTAADVGTRVILAGWLLPERKVSKAMSFFPLRDSFGTTQLVVARKKVSIGDLAALSDMPVESAVLVEGEVCLRPENDRRPEATGQIEVQVDRVLLLNSASRNMPFIPSDLHNLPNEDLRARYRYLDLRRPALSDNLRKRSRVAHIVRTTLHDQGFVEIETPMLLKSSPEGAREFLVPTRISDSLDSSSNEPHFFALQQSPQQPKQLLVCSGGIDKYFQLARCFRDEDGRKDRQPEFTQIDLEMAFTSWGEPSPSAEHGGWRIGGSEVRYVVERMVQRIWQEVEGVVLPETFEVMTYSEAMTRFGSDKPDTRFGLEISDISSLLPFLGEDGSEKCDDILECLAVHRDSPFINAAREWTSATEPLAERIILTEDNLPSWLQKNRRIISDIDGGRLAEINSMLQLGVGDALWLQSRSRHERGGSTALGQIRIQLSELAQARGDYMPSESPNFLWITEFPLFTRCDNEKDFLAQGRWSSTHHPFTAPMWQDIPAMYNGQLESVRHHAFVFRDEISSSAQVRGQHYDLVLNGVEIGGGSVRVHDADMQGHIFSEILQLRDDEKASFHHLLHALQCGAPPHGGIALGFDRLMAILCKANSIRDVIAFPKTSAGTDLLFRSPAPIDNNVLHQYGIQPRGMK